MKFDNTLILSDIDGTFIASDRQPVKRNLDAVRYFIDNGGMFALSTGRNTKSMKVYEDIIDSLCNVPCICCNGAYSFNFKEMKKYNEIFLQYEPTMELLRKVLYGDYMVNIRLAMNYSDDHVFLSIDPENDRRELPNLIRLSEIKREELYRVSFDGSNMVLNSLREEFEEQYSEYFSFVFAYPTVYEFNNRIATKGTALDKLRSLLIEQGRADNSLKVYAMGDYENDIDMLLHADYAACPSNAIDSVKKVSQIQLCSCDEGAAADLIEYIERQK